MSAGETLGYEWFLPVVRQLRGCVMTKKEKRRGYADSHIYADFFRSLGYHGPNLISLFLSESRLEPFAFGECLAVFEGRI